MRQVPHAPLPYRSDIDGLRAIAVLAVVLFHFGVPGPNGGFVGIDVFFVISGFLIGGILWREYDSTGTIRLGHFYLRRFRRLMPAFCVMALLTTGVAWAILLPVEFRDYGRSLVAATVYLSNVLFHGQVGYFDAVAADKPLVHTWSLAVAAQFYIFLPLFILVMARWRGGLVAALVALWALSLAACILLTPAYSSATFYLFPFRAWELLSGVLLAIWGIRSGRQWRGHAILSWLGLALVLASIAYIPPGPSFPGTLALLPVIGTVLLLANGTGPNMVNRALCHPAAVFFGRISCSLYLWHWPVFALASYLRGDAMTLAEATIWMLFSVALAYLTWRFVENPVRRARALPDATLVGGTAVASVALVGIGAVLLRGDGLPGRFDADVRPHIRAAADVVQDWSRCYRPGTGPLMGLEVCPIGPEGAPRVLVWGDSHVRALRAGLDAAAHKAGTPAIILWRAGCPPLFDVRKIESTTTAEQDTACRQDNIQIKQSFAGLGGLEKVVLIGRWTYYATGHGVGIDAQNTIKVLPADAPLALDRAQSDTVAEAARATVAHLLGSFDEVLVLRQPPEIAFYDSRSAARKAAHAALPFAAPTITEPHIARDALAARTKIAEAPWRAMARDGAISWIDTWPRICDATACHAVHDGVGYYFDNNHLTDSASLALRDLLEPAFRSGTRKTAMQ